MAKDRTKCTMCDKPRGIKTEFYCKEHYLYWYGEILSRPTKKNFPMEYKTWKAMIYRCTNPKATGYQYYGGRGIKVCDEWLNSFEAFLNHIGRKPHRKFSIDRINNDGNYEPGNVRWATQTQQFYNSRLYFDGLFMPRKYRIKQ